MEQISLAQLNSALTPTAAPSQRQLKPSDMQILSQAVAQMADRYPSQDLSGSLEGYLWDFQRLALKYSLPRVIAALAELRIKPGQKFFPRPDEVAAQIEAGQEARRATAERNSQARRRAAEIEAFWAWAPEWMADTGNSEEELLQRWPSMRGTKARAE